MYYQKKKRFKIAKKKMVLFLFQKVSQLYVDILKYH
jgi:hypothetical protein